MPRQIQMENEHVPHNDTIGRGIPRLASKQLVSALRWHFRAIGIINTFTYIWKTKALNKLKSRTAGSYCLGTLNVRGLAHPVVFRYGSSDISVFKQIFVEDEYSPLRPSVDIRLILDCGANVGYSSCYFLSRFPAARVIAIEPDPRNFEVIERNLRPYGDRVQLVRGGIWSRKAKLKVCTGEFGDGREWATIVRECKDGEEPDVEAVDIGTLLDESGLDRIDILKIDIEGSEREVFSRDYETWLDKVHTFIIELHGSECEDAFVRALGPVDYFKQGELTFARRHLAV
jgi:FkbM family methyltransferase